MPAQTPVASNIVAYGKQRTTPTASFYLCIDGIVEPDGTLRRKAQLLQAAKPYLDVTITDVIWAPDGSGLQAQGIVLWPSTVVSVTVDVDIVGGKAVATFSVDNGAGIAWVSPEITASVTKFVAPPVV